MQPPPDFPGAGQSSETPPRFYNQFISLVKTPLQRDVLVTPDVERNSVGTLASIPPSTAHPSVPLLQRLWQWGPWLLLGFRMGRAEPSKTHSICRQGWGKAAARLGDKPDHQHPSPWSHCGPWGVTGLEDPSVLV